MRRTLRPLPRRVGAAVLVAVLAGALASCASGPETTTCGEVRGMSEAERADLVREVAAEAGAEDPDDAAAVAARLLQGCQGQGDDVTLDEVEQFPTRD